MKLALMVLGEIQENCYFYLDEETGEGFIVDPGIPAPEIIDTINNMGIQSLKYILLTHGHYDHILGTNFVKEHFPGAKIVVCKEELAYLTDPHLSHAMYHNLQQDPITADLIVEDESRIPFAQKEIRVLNTPGHTPGCVCYLIDDIMFSGDTLFCKTYGRTDLPGGNAEDMKASLERLGQLEGNYNVLPGHGPQTNLDFERTHNRYMRKLSWS